MDVVRACRGAWPRLPWLILLLASCSPPPAPADSAGVVGDRAAGDSRALLASVESVRALRDLVPPAERRGAVILQHDVDLEFGRFAYGRAESRWLTVYDLEDSTIAEEFVELGTATLRAAEAWRVREDGAFERLAPADHIFIQSDRGGSRARIRFTDLAPGDLYGWSMTTRETQGRAHVRVMLSADRYLVRGRLRLGGDAQLTHRVAPRQVEGHDVQVEITERKRGFPHRISVAYADLPAFQGSPFARPTLLREPHLEITRHGRFYQELDAWVLNNDWDLWIALELGNPKQWIDRSTGIRDRAIEVTASARTDREKADALYRFVRDAIHTLDAGTDERLFVGAAAANNLDLSAMQRELDEEADSPLAQRFRDAQQLPPAMSRVSSPILLRPSRSASAVLSSGEGTRLEKTVLLASLFAAVDLEQRITFARDRTLGPHDHDSTGAWQFTDAFVVLLTPDLRPDLWYCATREQLPPGVLPVSLQSVPMLSVKDDFESELVVLWERARKSAGTRVQLRVPEWIRHIRAADWTVWTRTPGDPGAPCAALEEVIRWTDDLQRAELTLRTQGEIEIESANYSRGRFPIADAIEHREDAGPTAEAIQQRLLRAELQLEALPAPDGGTWRLAGPTLFGSSHFRDWARERQDFHVERTTDFVWRTELPLPAGWTAIVPVPEFAEQHDRLTYRARIRVDGELLVFERTLRLVAGTSPNSELVDPIADIRMFENGWLVVQAAQAGR